MGTTLTNGVYLPNEGERNCYAGLKTNWEILDQKVADVTALQQAVAGALHREIVESLPSTDIDPNTIYMILSGTSATENVYNEYMYVNNAWELIGTSATDLTNYYTKSEVDDKLLLKASVSDLTSHTGDTTIHVTASDKNKWNNQTYVFRYSSTALVASSTNSNTLLDNTDNLKVGDKVIDSSGVLFSITAIDTANSTFTVGSALVDLALDANVVHTSGNETVGGFKQFANIRVTNSIKGINLDSTTTDLNNCYSDFAPYGESKGGNIQYYYCNTDAGTANISNLPEAKAFFLISITTRLISNSLYVKQTVVNSTNKTYTRYCNNGTWGSWVNETDKYVTIDTAQTVSGAKTFLDVPITLKSSTAELGVTGGNTKVIFTDKNLLNLAGITFGNYGSSKLSYCRFHIYDKDSNNQEVENFIEFSYVNNNQVAYFRPNKSNFVTLGTVNNRWSKVYADEFYYGSNNVEFSTKFVTTDTAQTISGAKTFSDNLTIYNSDDTQTPKGLTIRNAQWGMGESGGLTTSNINFLDKNSAIPASIIASKGISGQSFLRFSVRTKDSQNNALGEEIYYDIDTSGNVEFRSWHDNIISLGTSAYKWKDVQTKLINGLEPSALGMPVAPSSTSYIDISSYITVLDNSASNKYTPPSNGYITFHVKGSQVQCMHNYGLQAKWSVSSGSINRGFIPVLGGVEIDIYVSATDIYKFWFIPCQGNI